MGNVSRISSSTSPISMLLVLILFSFTPLIHSTYRTVDWCMVSASLLSWKVSSSNVNNDDTSHPLLLLSLAFQPSPWHEEECKCHRFDQFDCCFPNPASDPVVFLLLPLSAIIHHPSSFASFLPPRPLLTTILPTLCLLQLRFFVTVLSLLRHRSFSSASPDILLCFSSSLRPSFLLRCLPSLLPCVPSFLLRLLLLPFDPSVLLPSVRYHSIPSDWLELVNLKILLLQ